MHAALDVRPDLLLLGKIIGGGLPAGALGGQADRLELTAASRAGALSHAGTFNGHVLSYAMALQRVAALAPLSV
jgi:glutamate-1-semialdehyde 2,1-aminomutase